MRKIALLFGLFILLVSGCDRVSPFAQLAGNGDFIQKRVVAMGTDCSLKLPKDTPKKVFDAVFKRIYEIDAAMSSFKEESEVSKINGSAGLAPVAVSAETLMVIKTGLAFSEKSGGLFDITIGPLVKLWGIGTKDQRVPTSQEIRQAKALVNYRDVEIEHNAVFLKKKGMMLDLGAVAKGYAADEAVAVLKKMGVPFGLINFGGNVVVFGKKPAQKPWHIGIMDPFLRDKGDSSLIPDQKILGYVEVEDKTVVTSGDYERFFMEDGVRYHHILDPFSGYPVQNRLRAVVIITDRSTEADALSTTVFLMGLEKGLKFLETLPEVQGIFITKEKELFATKGIAARLVITDDSFTLKGELPGVEH